MDWCSILEDFHQELLKHNVLEEVDELCLDSLVLRPNDYKCSILLRGSAVVASIATIYGLYKGSYWSYLSASVSIGSASFLLNQVLLKRRLSKFVNCLIDCQRSARETVKRISKRELIAVSLNLFSHARIRWRDDCLREFRSIIRITCSWSAQLIVDMRLDTEVKHQLENFYSDEMKSLLFEDNDSYSNDRGLLALLDLFNLHRSELARVTMLSLINSTDMKDKLFMSSSISKINDCLEDAISRMNEICVIRAESQVLKKNIQQQAFSQTHGLQNIAIALADLSHSICEEKTSVDEVELVLHRIQGMLCMYRSKVDVAKMEESKPFTSPSEEEVAENANVAYVERPPEGDQMFETVAISTGNNLDEEEDYCDWSSPKGDASLMSELKMALCDKSAEFSKRERKALAEFYGVSEEELKEREEAQRNQELQQSSEANELCSLGEGGDGASEWSRPPAPAFAALPSELLKALASRRNDDEECIGDSEEEFE